MKLIKLFFFFLFISFAVLQWNDPDPMLWIAIYAVTALLILFDISGKNIQNLYLTVILALSIFSLYYIPGVIEYFLYAKPGELAESMQAEKSYIEETREFGGLLVIICAVSFFYFRNKF